MWWTEVNSACLNPYSHTHNDIIGFNNVPIVFLSVPETDSTKVSNKH